MTEILTRKPPGRRVNLNTALAFAATARKASPWRIGIEALLLSWGASKLDAKDYFLHGAWQPSLNWAERRAFIGSGVNLALNRALNPIPTEESRAVIEDKLVSEQHFRAAGLPVMPIKAVAATLNPGDGQFLWLSDPEAVLDFLREPEALPCFGKPVHGSTGLGAVRLEGWEDESTLRLGDGQCVSAKDLVAEIWAEHRRGYIFAQIAAPHSELKRMIGPIIGSLRVVTVDAGGGPEVLYSVLKCPARDATVDSAAGPLGSILAVDRISGRIHREQDRRSLGGIDAVTNLVSGVALSGQLLPDFAAAMNMARAAHASLGDHGILGIDIFLTNDGPLVSEANANPHHSMYQIGYARGLLNPVLLPRLKAVRARYLNVTPRTKHCPLR